MVKMWTDQGIKRDAKKLASSLVEMHGWKGVVPDVAENTVSELIRTWNEVMAANVCLNQLSGFMTDEGRTMADNYAEIIRTFASAIHPSMRDQHNITMELVVIGALVHLHEQHAFMLER
jgi:hypothetical protein